MSLDLRTRLGIRDYWDAPNSAVQPQLGALRSVLGTEVDLQSEWGVIAEELGTVIADKTRIVQLAAGITGAWLNVLVNLLDDDACEDWTGKLVDKVSAANRLVVSLGVSDTATPVTNFKEPNAFVLSLPRADVPGSSEFDALHKQQLLACFDIGDTEHDDWAQVNTAGVVTDSAPAVMTSALPLSASIRPAAHVAATLPKADALPRPDHLLATPPYYLVVSEAGRQMEITATHSATLELIKEYLNKWCRLDHTKTNKPTYLEFNLSPPMYSLSGHDKLTIRARDDRYSDVAVTSPIVLALAEKLGYSLIKIRPGSWVYRREQPFQ